MKNYIKIHNRKLFGFFIFFLNIGFLFFVFGCGGGNPSSSDGSNNQNKLTNEKATKLIQYHLRSYSDSAGIKIGELRISAMDEKNGLKAKKTCEDLHGLGLIDYSIRYDKNNMENVFTTSLTEKGKNHKHAWLEWDANTVMFEIGEYEILEIVKIDEKENMVYFAVEYIPNDIGKSIGREIKKYRAKAKIEYDDFLKRFAWKGAMGCAWEGGDWYKTSWIVERDGKTICNVGI